MADVILDERIVERRREVRVSRKRRRLRRTIAVAVGLALLVAAVVGERSGLVALEEIQVVGTERLSPESVIAAAALPLGTSTVRLGLGDAEDRVRALPLVADVAARRVDPLTVEIAVTERRPVAIVTSADGDAVLVDRDAVVVSPGSEDGLTVLTTTGTLPEPGQVLAADSALGNAHAVAMALSGPLGAEVVRYEAVGPRDVQLVLAGDRRVRFGAADRIDEKVRALGAVLEDVGAAEVSIIDVRAPSTPTVVRSP